MSPPALARLVLWLVVRDALAREVIEGDLVEGWSLELASGKGRRAASRWYWWQALASSLAWLRSARERAAFGPRGTGFRPWRGLGTDLRHAVRSLCHQPGFTAVAVVTVAIGVAGTASVFSLLDAVLLRPLPYQEPNRLVMVSDESASDNNAVGNTGFATYEDWRRESHSFEQLAILRFWGPVLLGEGEPEQLQGLRASANLLATLGVRPALGRGFTAEDDDPERRYVTMLTDALWRRRFGADPAVIGRSLDLGGTLYQVVGVLPPSFDPAAISPFFGAPDLISPLGYRASDPWGCRSCHHLKVLGRLAPGASIALAREDLMAVQSRLLAAFPNDYADARVRVIPLSDALYSQARPVLFVVTGAVGLLLLIACANVASLLLARSRGRVKEVRIRAALGADRSRLVRLLLSESLLLAGLGGGLGLALAGVLIRVLVAGAPPSVPRIAQAGLDLRVTAFALLVMVASGVLFGLAPALGLASPRPDLELSSRATAGRPATRGRRLLVMGNLALAFVLLVGAGLMLTSVHRLLRVDPGFDAHGVLVMRLSFLAPRYDEEAGIHRAVAAISREVAALPGVEAVGMAGQIPLGGNYDSWGAEVEGRKSDRPQDRLDLQRYAVTPGYRQVMRLPLVAGRWIGDEDRSDTLPVMVLGETAARQLFGAESPLGKRIRIGGPERPWRTVVGVVGDVRHQALSSQVSPQMYLPLEQSTDPFLVMVVRTGGEPTALAPAVRARVVATAQDVPIYGVASLEELAARTAFRESFTSTLLTLFAASALLLASVGLYALVAFLVEARRKEVGVRVALGALRADICRLVLGPGLALVGAGLGLGWLAAVLLSRLLAGLLYEVSPDDPLTYATIAAVLVGTAGLAHLVPLARALGVDPVTTLRED